MLVIQSDSATPWSVAHSSIHEILQARILEWVAIPFFWDLPNPGIEPGSPALQADSSISVIRLQVLERLVQLGSSVCPWTNHFCPLGRALIDPSGGRCPLLNQ